jgi:ATP-dependent helicase HrpB
LREKHNLTTFNFFHLQKQAYLTFNPFHNDLPVREIIPEVQQHLNCENTLIVSAPAGAGKSTLIPLALMDESWLKGKKILMLEPRRLAARMIAARMSFLLEQEVGQTVGYRIRFENRVSAATQIEVVTEGILARMLHSDNALEGVGLVIFDEFHERSIHADVALALCRESQQILRPDLRILVMSATLDMPSLTTLLGAKAIESSGKQFPVEIIYAGETDEMVLPEMAARVVVKAVRENEGDTLVFLPGEEEIRRCEEILKSNLNQFVIHPLYGQLPQFKQNEAIIPDRKGRRKVVLATSIAETSLTIEGIKIVVDTGFGRVSKFDPRSGLSRLETIRVAQDSADQRAGRAGRLSPGVCYRMWANANHQKRAAHRTPEILEADLAPLVLDMARWGIKDILDLTWLTPPPQATLAQASKTLHELEALENGLITAHGKAVHALPCHPRIAHMLLMAKEEKLLPLATDIAALLEERDPLPRDSGIDINLRIEKLRKSRKENQLTRSFQRIEKVAASYRELLHVKVDNGIVNPYETGILLVHAYPERIACARPGNNAQFQLSNGRLAMASHQDDLAHEPWLAVAHLDARDGMGKIFLASPLNPKDLAPLVKQQEVIAWETRKGGLIAATELRIGNIILQTKPLNSPNEELVKKAISEIIRKEGENLLNFDEEVAQWQNRVLSLRKWRPDDNWPDVSTPGLLETNEKWLMPHLTHIRKNEDLQKVDLARILHQSLSWEQQAILDRLAPARIKVPTGSNIKLEYKPDGSAPVLAVRLQEVFGMADTPTVNDGKISVLMHLLSPGYKPVQVTADLRSFWNTAYFEVKKELKRRYPKHAWPDDPWIAEAVSGVRRRKV